MAVSKLNPVSGGKTRRVLTLTSGTSWTVPSGVEFVNVTLIGGGGGAGGNSNARGGNGGTTTFTGATSASGGTGGPTTSSSFAYSGSTGVNPGAGGTAAGGSNSNYSSLATDGAVISSTLATTPGASIAYTIGSGGTGGGSTTGQGGNGANGKIDIEYWVQEIILRTFAVIENNKVVNIIVGVEPEIVAANPDKYVDYTDGWDFNNGIDGGDFFPAPVTE